MITSVEYCKWLKLKNEHDGVLVLLGFTYP